MSDARLRVYRDKRDASRTPEPFGGGVSSGGERTGGSFVVQQHAARRMHWDLRLEVNGVLASWAVPRGPSSDPQEKRLAVRTEDHPIEYADFEGTIPPGNYGAGAMIVWDRGTFHTVGGTAVADDLTHGKLDVELHGHKLQGRWALVRIKGEGGKDWLLIKKGGGVTAGPELVVAQPRSVLSGLTVSELGAGTRRTSELAARAQAAGAPRRGLDAAQIRPMLAETAAHAFSRDGWLFELKYDGVRILAARAPTGSVTLYYRTGRDTTATFPEIARAVAHLPCDDFILDGEVVALDERGIASFELLQQRLGQTDANTLRRAAVEVPVIMFCFDLLAVAGHDLRTVPLSVRKELLNSLVPRVGVVRFADHVEREGEALFDEINTRRLEGVVAKRAASPYRSGRRSPDWLKIKALQTADVAIVGYLRGKGARHDLGSLMVAWRSDGELEYAGNVGTGLDAPTLAALLPQLQQATRNTPAFRGTPAGPARDQVFVEPRLVAEVRFIEVTSSGYLRQPVFLRLRDDKSVEECDHLPVPHVRPQVLPASAVTPQPTRPPGDLRLSNLDKVFWPAEGYTKGDLVRYYEEVWPWLAPYLRDRPVVLTRYPDGITGKSFFQKNAPGFTPEWVQTFRIEDTDYFICNDLQTLLYVINSGCIPLHVWSARRDTLDRPDWTILDLDPKGAPFQHVIAVAHRIHTLLDELAVPHFVKTSGQDGLHVLVPLGALLTHAEARAFAEVLARIIADEQSDIATVTRAVGARQGKVYVDFLQNGQGKTIVAPFSVRPRAGAPVSTPLRWREVGARLDPARFTIRTVPPRLRRIGDPMRQVLEVRTDIHAALAALSTRLR
ncbi:MAG TPA: DNA ligase D [Candidatus Margulisiibacteriota bacterium]|nr:DNA ligase D [Candidatus Margulisiibacteriota bacterium]